MPKPQTQMNKKNNLFAVYAVVSQFAFVVLVPLLVFIVGGHYLYERFALPDWVMVLFIVLGVVFMGCCAVYRILQLVRLYAADDKSKYRRYYSDPRDNDYADEYKTDF